MSRTRWPAACPRCGGDVVRIGYLFEDHQPRQRPRVRSTSFVCWRCQARLEFGPGGAFQIAAEVGIRDAPTVRQCAGDLQVFLCLRCRTYLKPALAPDHRCYNYRQIHLPSWKRAVRKRT